MNEYPRVITARCIEDPDDRRAEAREYEFNEGYNHGKLHATHSDFPLSGIELESYPPRYREGYHQGYWDTRNTDE